MAINIELSRGGRNPVPSLGEQAYGDALLQNTSIAGVRVVTPFPDGERLPQTDLEEAAHVARASGLSRLTVRIAA
jgi:hypothetical protein